MNPLSESGYPIDPATLKPEFLAKQERKLDQERRYKKLIEQSQDIINELADGRGEIVKVAVKLFADRIDKLIESDPECQAYDKLFKELKITIDAGQKIANARAFSLLK